MTESSYLEHRLATGGGVPVMSFLSSRSIPLGNVLRYWRDSLADEDIMGLSESGDAVRLLVAQIDRGRLAREDIVALWEAASKLKSDSQGQGTRGDDDAEEPDFISLVVLAKGLMPVHERGVSRRGHDSRPVFPLVIPARLYHDGTLQPEPGNLPWIGREYLGPNEMAGDRPIVGDCKGAGLVMAWVVSNHSRQHHREHPAFP